MSLQSDSSINKQTENKAKHTKDEDSSPIVLPKLPFDEEEDILPNELYYDFSDYYKNTTLTYMTTYMKFPYKKPITKVIINADTNLPSNPKEQCKSNEALLPIPICSLQETKITSMQSKPLPLLKPNVIKMDNNQNPRSLQQDNVLDNDTIDSDIKARNIPSKYMVAKPYMKRKAFIEVKEGIKTKEEIAKEYKISIRTLQRWLHNGTTERKKGSGKYIKDIFLEERIYQWVKSQPENTITRRQIQKYALEVVNLKEDSGKIISFKGSHGWLRKFLIRHPDIILKKMS